MTDGEILLIMLAIPYFLPAVIGLVRNHHQKWAILALDTFLGWTVIGWGVSLAWALTAKQKAPARQ